MRKAFTLIELLVVISIIGMLAALLLPAVQSAREAARRGVCISNQKNVALAIINYENSRQGFPGYITVAKGENVDNRTNGIAVGWPLAIAQQIEQGNLYEKVITLAGTELTETLITGAGYQDLRLEVLQCPSSAFTGSELSYVVNCGPMNFNANNLDTLAASLIETGKITITQFDPARQRDTLFVNRRGAGAGKRLDSFRNKIDYIATRDGTSNTIMCSENVDAGRWWSTKEYDLGFCYAYLAAYTDCLNGTDANYNNSIAVPWNTYWSGTSTGTPAVVSGPIAPARINRYIDNALTNYDSGATVNRYRVARPSSRHPGIVVAGLCDGSVRTLNEEADAEMFYYLLLPDSKEVVDFGKL